MALPKFYLELRALKQRENESSEDFIKRQMEQVLPINMFFSVYGSRLQYYCGHRVKRKYYKDFKLVKNLDGFSEITKLKADRSDPNKLISDSAPYSDQIKANLRQIALDAQNIANQAKANKIPVTKEYLRVELDKIHKHKEQKVEVKETFNFVTFFIKMIEESKNGSRLMRSGKNAGKRYSHNAVKNYGSTLSVIKRYMAAKRIRTLAFTDINKIFYDQFRDFCFEVEKKEISTFAGYVKDIKTVMNEAKEFGYQTEDGHKSSSFVLPSYEADTIYLNDKQIDKIAALDLSNYIDYIVHQVPARDGKKKPLFDKDGNRLMMDEKVYYSTLDKVRDLSLVGFYTGLRFGNFSNLKAKDIHGAFLKIKQIKTGALVTIPIMQKLKPVLEKYPNDFPTLSNQKFNSILKLIAKLAGLDETVSVKSFKGNIETSTEFPLWSLMTSHICRRSYATNMFRKGVPTILIMSATGHRSESSFLVYIRATNEDKAILMAHTLEKLGL